MSSTGRSSLAELFGELVELPAEARATRLRTLAADDPSLAAELSRLLEADAAAGDFLGVLSEPGRGPSGERFVESANSGRSWRIGTRVGPYQLLQKLGEGGMAVVWLARDERLDRRVALKLFAAASDPPVGHSSHLASQHHAPGARFLAEASAAAQLDHPHVAVVHDVGESADGTRFIAMAWCTGGSLAERLARGPLDVADALRIARQVASALQAAHSRGIVHRDVKPANVLFDADGGARLADFGIATFLEADATRSGVVRGTAHYVAPEQLRGQAITHRVDLWAFGVMLYEMLAGARPFTGDSDAALMYAIVSTEPPPLSHRTPPLPSAIVVLLSALLAKDPDARPRTAGEVVRALDAASGNSNTAQQALAAGRADPAPSRVLVSPASPLTPLIGRERELALAASFLEHVRLLTLTGTGGTGKTRLAGELARLMAPRYPDGVHVVALAGISSPDQVAPTIVQALMPRSAGGTEPEEQLRRSLAGSHALLVLDNFEHVLDAAPLVSSLLASAPRLSIVVTSRAPLHLQGEQELPVPPLSLPATESPTVTSAAASDSVRLFVLRGRAVRPDFNLSEDNVQAVVEICHRLDGLPLAIELAAARVKLLSPATMLRRLTQRFDLLRTERRDVAPRHRTMRDAIAWSHALLTPDEQRLLRRLSVFAGGFTLESAAAVCASVAHSGSEDPVGEILEGLSALVDNSLLIRREQPDGEVRLQMLETIREYALARLRADDDEAALRLRHQRHFLSMAEEAATHARGAHQVQWLQRVLADNDNLFAAIDFSLVIDDLDAASRFCVALHRYWIVARAFLGEALAVLQRIDDRTRDQPGRILLAREALLLSVRGLLHGVRGDPLRVSHALLARSVEAFGIVKDDAGRATAQNHYGWTAYLLGDYETGESASQDALTLHRASDNALGVAISLVNLGWITFHRGRLVEAAQRFDEAVAIHRGRADRRSLAFALSNVGAVLHCRGEHAQALSIMCEVLELAEPLHDIILTCGARSRAAWARHEGMLDAVSPDEFDRDILPPLRKLGHAWSIGFALSRQGQVLSDLGDFTRGRLVLRESEMLRRQSGDRSGTAESQALLARLAAREGNRVESASLWTASLELRQALGEPIGVLECIEGIAQLAALAGDAAIAVQLMAGADRLRNQLGVSISPRYRADEEGARNALRQRVGDEEWRRSWDEGVALSDEGLVRLAQRTTSESI